MTEGRGRGAEGVDEHTYGAWRPPPGERPAEQSACPKAAAFLRLPQLPLPLPHCLPPSPWNPYTPPRPMFSK